MFTVWYQLNHIQYHFFYIQRVKQTPPALATTHKQALAFTV